MRPAEGNGKVWRKNGRMPDTRDMRRRRPTARELRVMRAARVMTLAQLARGRGAVMTAATAPTIDQRREFCEASVTLDGRRAKICGARNDFATVRTLPDGAAYEWAWPTVARIVANGGAFRS